MSLAGLARKGPLMIDCVEKVENKMATKFRMMSAEDKKS